MSIILTILFTCLSLLTSAAPSDPPLPSNNRVAAPPAPVFLDPFEVSVKKKEVGKIWSPKVYFSSQRIHTEGEKPDLWNREWYQKMKRDHESR